MLQSDFFSYICSVLFRLSPNRWRDSGLKGNQVQVLNSPAAVSSVRGLLITPSHCLYEQRWEGKQTRVSQKTCKTKSCFLLSRKK